MASAEGLGGLARVAVRAHHESHRVQKPDRRARAMGVGVLQLSTRHSPHHRDRPGTSRVKFRAVLVVAGLATALMPLDPVKVERWYSTALYPRVQGLITPVTNRVPFALLDIAVALCLICLAILVVRR